MNKLRRKQLENIQIKIEDLKNELESLKDEENGSSGNSW